MEQQFGGEASTAHYVYANYFYNNYYYGTDMFDKWEDIYLWANIMESHRTAGAVTWWRGDPYPYLDNVNIVNNTFYNNGFTDGASDPVWTGFANQQAGATNFSLYNNISSENRPDTTPRHQFYFLGVETSDYNQVYHSSGTASWYIGGDGGGERTLAQMQALGKETNSDIENPSFSDPSAHTVAGFEPGSSTSANDGTDKSGTVGTITLTGSAIGSYATTYTMDMKWIMAPTSVFSSTDPMAINIVLHDNSSSPERGAVAYVP